VKGLAALRTNGIPVHVQGREAELRTEYGSKCLEAQTLDLIVPHIQHLSKSQFLQAVCQRHGRLLADLLVLYACCFILTEDCLHRTENYIGVILADLVVLRTIRCDQPYEIILIVVYCLGPWRRPSPCP
jgi:hypothetical protein